MGEYPQIKKTLFKGAFNQYPLQPYNEYVKVGRIGEVTEHVERMGIINKPTLQESSWP